MPTTKALDREVELLLAGTPIVGGRLSGLAPVMEMIRNQWTLAPSETEIADFARSAESAVKAAQSFTTAVTTLQRRPGPRRHGLSPRLATVGLAVLLMSGTAGMALAANGAVPGDALYGLDRGFERVGLGSGSADERLEEAVVMAAHGRSDEALAHGIEALSGDSGDSAAVALGALTTASENLVHIQDTAHAASTANIRVSALLTYIAENIGKDVGADGREFGQGVAQLARDIGEGDGPTGAQDPAVAPVPGPGQSNNPGVGAGNQGSNDGTGPGNENSNGNGNSQDNPTGNGNSNGNDNSNDDDPVNGNGNGNGSSQDNPTDNGNGNSQDNPTDNGNDKDKDKDKDVGPPAESPSVTAPGRENGPPEDSPSVTAPGKGNKP